MTTIDLKGRTAIVTGAARGIGFACIERFLASGARCVLWDVDPKALDTAKKALAGRGEIETTAVDITRPAQVRRAVAKCLKRFGGVDILVNNAGIAGVSKKLWECTTEEWSAVVDLNVMGVFHCCHAVIPEMIRAGRGRIVNVASIAGKEGNPNASHYSASKSAVIGLTKSLGKELAQTGVLVNCITPAVIQTDILKQCSPEHVKYMLSKIPMGRAGEASEVAALVAWLSSDECSFSTGAVFDISGGRATY
jgi:NAD(P)-dependent dehydrogenase (short-subunit alcohol dehydrogenase family)